MLPFCNNLIQTFLISLGVITGASLFAGLGAIINDQPPFSTMLHTARSIKIWAVAVALGDTFSSFEILEQGLFKMELRLLGKQFIYVMTAILGANCGYILIKILGKCGALL